MNEAPHPSRKTKIILRAQYFIYFGAMGIYLPYFNLYCYHLGFDGFQIGAISALRSVLLVVFPIAWGALADRFRSRKPIYILCNALAAIAWMGYLFTTDFLPMMIITLLHGVFYSPIISFLETFTMEGLGREKRQYGLSRVWGSISFISVVVLVGRAIDASSIDIVIPFFLVGAVAMAVMSFGVAPSGKKKDLGIGGVAELYSERMVVFLFCAFLMLLSHGAYYGFFSIHLETLGFDKTFIGLSWALASISEIGIMLNSERIFRKHAIEKVLVFAFFVAAARWFLLSSIKNPWLILGSQVLHAVTYGAFHVSSILYIDRLSPSAAKTLGQATNNAFSYGLGLMVGFFLSGYLYESIGADGLFMTSGFIALAGGLVFSLYQRRRPPEPA